MKKLKPMLLAVMVCMLALFGIPAAAKAAAAGVNAISIAADIATLKGFSKRMAPFLPPKLGLLCRQHTVQGP